jgi:ceramide glucosyltransferase
MIWAFYFFAAVLVLLSIKSFLSGLRYRQFFIDELKKPPSTFSPFVTVIAPCRGLDEGLYANLGSLFLQDYPAFEIIFVVDDEDDPAVAVIDMVMDAATVPSRLVVAPKAAGCSQKVENLCEAVLHADAVSQAFVFVDSDTRVGSGWLRGLICALEDPDVGASTGYRWFISDRPTFASEMQAAWNASIASALGPNRSSNFCWGGSMAIRRDTFEAVDMREKWRGTLSDDFAVTRAMKAAGRHVAFAPQAMTASFGNCTLRELFEFTTRQMKITRVNAPHLWLMTLFGSVVFNSVLVAAFCIVIFSRGNGLPVLISLAVLALVSIFSIGKAWVRCDAVGRALPAYERQLRRQMLPQNTLWLLTGVVFSFNSVAALFSRQMTWRGIRYELKSPNETVIITD